MSLVTLSALAGLFLSALGAATILPFASEVVFAAMIFDETAPVWVLIVVASIGNTLGSVVNYWMGRYVERWKGSRWFPVTEERLGQAQRFFTRYGAWTLLLSWAPYADPLTIIAGILRIPFTLFLVLVAIAKTGRFVVLAWLLT